MTSRGMWGALGVSLLINATCIAWLGGSDLVHPRKTPPPPTDIASALHPVSVSLETMPKAPAQSDSAAGKSGSGGSASGRPKAGSGSGSGSAESSDINKDHQSSFDTSQEASEDTPRNREQAHERNKDKRGNTTPMEQRQASQTESPKSAVTPSPQEVNQNASMRLAENETQSETKDALLRRLAQQSRRAADLGGQPPALSQQNGNEPHSSSGKRPGGAGEGGQNQKSSNGMRIVTSPSLASWHGGVHHQSQNAGNSYSPFMMKFPKMKIDAGTIHVRRPLHGTIGGGSADMRNVEITAHYVIDDPKAGPGPQSIHLPGKVLPGINHVTGKKYCLAGAPSLPGDPGSVNYSGQGKAQQDGQGKTAGMEYRPSGIGRIGSEYHGSGAATNYVETRVADPGSPSQIPTDTLHLPTSDDDVRGLIPGAKVPVLDRKLVADPRAHDDLAPIGLAADPMPRFTVAPHDIGSLSENGTVDWGKPHPVSHKKKPFGGDGTGLLGMYYTGQFQNLMFTRTDRDINYDWSGTGPGPLMPKSMFTVRWLGELVPRYTDTYTIVTTSDDGVRVYLDDQLIISDWTIHAATEDTATVSLVAGHHYKLKVEYFEKNGYSYEVMKMYWESPQQPREYIPESCLRYPTSADTGM